jgi:hypothetical protein
MKLLVTTSKMLVVLWMTVAMVATGVSGVVLCIGTDGRVALETAHAGHCEEHGAAHDHVPVGPSSLVADAHGAGCCDDVCIDVPLTLGDVSSFVVERHTPAQQLSEFLVVCSVAIAELPDLAPRRTYQPPGAPPRLSAALAAQRSIVLRV